MGLTLQSTGISTYKEIFLNKDKNTPVIALAGNPNVGKSTVFNSLTGLNQHTGNWPGKTVANAYGKYKYKDEEYILVDLPGTYSLVANSVEEEIARDFICFGKPDVTVIVTDATCLERNLNLVLQTLEVTENVVVCVNLIDEARRKNIVIDLTQLETLLGVPVVATNARNNEGLEELKEKVLYVISKNNNINPIVIEYEQDIEKAISIIQPDIKKMFNGNINERWVSIKLLGGDRKLVNSINEYIDGEVLENSVAKFKINSVLEYLDDKKINVEKTHDLIVEKINSLAHEICLKTVKYNNKKYDKFDRNIDRILTSKKFGIPIMLGLLGIIFWLTIQGANYPSQLLAAGLFWIESKLSMFVEWVGLPLWVDGLFIKGIYRTLAWVVSVMLPPMAIFFPLFTFLEDLGYLPRVAFNLDNFFKKACAHGKQALTMCMGFGCNAAGVIGCRIIDSPRERLIAIITNNFVPCNGRFPTLIAIAAIFIGGGVFGFYKSIITAFTVVVVIVIGIIMTLFISKLLSKTVLKGVPSSFVLELPPYRKPQIGRIIFRSIFDRTLFVLGRAITVAAPAGAVIWVLANITVGNLSLLEYTANFLDPFAQLIGMDGIILTAFILGLPANEIVIPIIIMGYMSAGSMLELESLGALRELLISNGWTWLTAVSVMLFSLMHFPCGTTLLTIRKETKSMKWTFLSFLIPTVTGVIVCFVVTQVIRLFGLV